MYNMNIEFIFKIMEVKLVSFFLSHPSVATETLCYVSLNIIPSRNLFLTRKFIVVDKFKIFKTQNELHSKKSFVDNCNS